MRNARGGNEPNIQKIVTDCERFGAEGITIHPRPDERHITRKDVYEIKPLVTTEFNIEGYPSEEFIEMVLEVQPHQVTLVPDPPDALTSNAGWDTLKNKAFLKEVIAAFKSKGIRSSIFVDTQIENIEGAAQTGTDRVELYTEPYAILFKQNPEKAVAPFAKAATAAHSLGLELNAGHDLSLENLSYFAKHVPHLDEVSIGHALVCDALYLGLENTIQMYLRCLK